MATPIESLKREHRAIEAVIGSLQNAAKQLRAGVAVDPTELQKHIDFIRNFADGAHHTKEEKILFPAMNAAGFPTDVGPIACMLGEHEQGRSHVRRMTAALEGLRKHDSAAAESFSQAAQSYAELLLAHIQKEDTVLFRMAETILGPERIDAMSSQFSAAENGDPSYITYEDWAHSLMAVGSNP